MAERHIIAVKPCAVCGRRFAYRVHRRPPRPAPAICGMSVCRSRHDWGPEDWAGRRRMARARLAAGIDLDDLDRHAIERAR